MLPLLALGGALGAEEVVAVGAAAAAGAAAVGAAVSDKESVAELSESFFRSLQDFQLFDSLIKQAFPLYGAVDSALKFSDLVGFSSSSTSSSTAVVADQQKDIDHGKVSDPLVKTIFQGVKDIVSKDTPEYVDSGDGLIEVLRSNGQNLVKAIDNMSLQNKDILQAQAFFAASIVSALYSISQALNNILVSNATSFSSLLQLQKNIDVQNILLSETYGVLFDSKNLLEGIKDVIGDIHTFFRSMDLEIKNVNNNTVVVDHLDKLEMIADALSKTKAKDEAILEKLNYEKSNQSITDLDGNVIGQLSPRSLKLIRDAVIAREKTDINNFELDDDDLDHLDLSSVLTRFGLEHLTDIIKNVQTGGSSSDGS